MRYDLARPNLNTLERVRFTTFNDTKFVLELENTMLHQCLPDGSHVPFLFAKQTADTAGVNLILSVLEELAACADSEHDHNEVSHRTLKMCEEGVHLLAITVASCLKDGDNTLVPLVFEAGTMAHDAGEQWLIDVAAQEIQQQYDDERFMLDTSDWSCEQSHHFLALIEIMQRAAALLPAEADDAHVFKPLVAHLSAVGILLLSNLKRAHAQLTLPEFCRTAFGQTLTEDGAEQVYEHMRSTARDVNAPSDEDVAFFHKRFAECFKEPPVQPDPAEPGMTR